MTTSEMTIEAANLLPVDYYRLRFESSYRQVRTVTVTPNRKNVQVHSNLGFPHGGGHL